MPADKHFPARPTVALPNGEIVVPVRLDSGTVVNRRYAGEALRIYIRNKLGLNRAVREREGSVVGAFVNFVAGEDPDHIELGGRIISQLVIEAGEHLSPQLDPRVIYRVRVDDLERLLVRAEMHAPPDHD